MRTLTAPLPIHQFDPVHQRHVQVEHDQVGRMLDEQLERPERIGHKLDVVVAVAFEHIAERRQVPAGVVDREDPMVLQPGMRDRGARILRTRQRPVR